MKAVDFFTNEQQLSIVQAISLAEKNTSGEIRVHLENRCKDDVLDRAAFLFAKLKMHETKLRNGVLIYLAIQDKKFAIIGDAGINSIVPAGFWDEIKEKMTVNFKDNKFQEGIIDAINTVGIKLKEFFPYTDDDINELTNDISFGK